MVAFSKLGRIAVTAFVVLVAAPSAMAQANCPAPFAKNAKPNWNDRTNGAAISAIQSGLEGAKKATDFSFVRAQVEQALAFCGGLVEKDRTNGAAQICVADASALLARSTQNDDTYSKAVCAYRDVDFLARDNNSLMLRRAAALEAKADALVEWSDRRGFLPGLLQEAVTAYSDANTLTAQTTAKRLWGMAIAERKLGAIDSRWFRDAETHYAILSAPSFSPPLSVDDRAKALTELALLKRDALKKPPMDVRATWIELLSVRPTAEANFELGKLEFDNSGVGAESYFQNAKTLAGAAGSSQANIAATSFYYLAVLRARRADWSGARDNAKESIVGGATYRRLACLTSLAAGDKALKDQNASSPLCQVTSRNFGEDDLVYGSYLLRRAQFVDYAKCNAEKTSTARNKCVEQLNETARGYLAEAFDVFIAGRDRPTENTSTPPKFNWLLVPESEAPELSSLLSYGGKVARILNSRSADRCDSLSQMKTSPPEKDLARDFFRDLDLLSCQPVRQEN